MLLSCCFLIFDFWRGDFLFYLFLIHDDVCANVELVGDMHFVCYSILANNHKMCSLCSLGAISFTFIVSSNYIHVLSYSVC